MGFKIWCQVGGLGQNFQICIGRWLFYFWFQTCHFFFFLFLIGISKFDVQKNHSMFFILCGNIELVYILLYKKKCHQHSYGFQYLMSSWGWKNTILEIILCAWVFKYLVPKVIFFFVAYIVVFWKFINFFENFKFSNLQQVGDFFFCIKVHFLRGWEA